MSRNDRNRFKQSDIEKYATRDWGMPPIYNHDESDYGNHKPSKYDINEAKKANKSKSFLQKLQEKLLLKKTVENNKAPLVSSETELKTNENRSCPKCGNICKEKDLFCTKCGVKVRAGNYLVKKK